MSLPSRGAWIEISLHLLTLVKFRSRSLHGERGLKSELYFAIFSPLSRSLHGERGLK